MIPPLAPICYYVLVMNAAGPSRPARSLPNKIARYRLLQAVRAPGEAIPFMVYPIPFAEIADGNTPAMA